MEGLEGGSRRAMERENHRGNHGANSTKRKWRGGPQEGNGTLRSWANSLPLGTGWGSDMTSHGWTLQYNRDLGLQR